ncbi:MAG: hypothetical protein ACO1N9_04875 [Flavobacterium sp.]
MQLEEKLAKNSFDNSKLLRETRAIFHEVSSLSIAHHDMTTVKDNRSNGSYLRGEGWT